MRVHASCVLIDDAAVLIRGPSGSGKSTLALALIAAAERRGRFARLVSDDRTGLQVLNGRVVARSVPSIAGRIEVRGVGLLTRAFEGAGVVRLVVDCLPHPPPRMPHESERTTVIGNVRLPRLVHYNAADFTEIVLWQLRGGHDIVMTAE